MIIKKRKLMKIGDVKNLTGMTARTIRYYDEVGLLPS
ncbi:MAG: MerR family transcriptional regulator, partial [Candidatus Margulisbacteria bacterium]|nr:MerR family transcriptional regulator [Candidatus Margulisiibacteriota bacterium]